MVDLACSLVVLVGAGAVGLAYAGRAAMHGRARNERADREGTSSLLPKAPIEMLYWALSPLVRACLALGKAQVSRPDLG